MSIQSEITRLTNATVDIKAAITEKGVTVPSGTKLDGLAVLIGNISSGTDTSDATMTSGGQMLSGVTAYSKDTKYTGTIPTKSSSDVTASGANVTVPAGYYASQVQKSVASGTAGTPTATKGTVSNHAIAVTPSVTNTTGYITGGTKNGTAVTVSASELVSGTKSITENGTGIDVTNYASVDVNVEGGGENDYVTFEFAGSNFFYFWGTDAEVNIINEGLLANGDTITVKRNSLFIVGLYENAMTTSISPPYPATFRGTPITRNNNRAINYAYASGALVSPIIGFATDDAVFYSDTGTGGDDGTN